MKFDSLSERMLYYRGLADYKLMPRSYVIVMLDGRSFSTLIKNKFEKPFDDDFIEMMNETAVYVCENIPGCKFGYVQSDEISIVVTDFENRDTDSFFSFRLNKMLSVIASMATAKFNNLMTQYMIKNLASDKVVLKAVEDMPLYQFDCKCWNLPNYEDVFGWFLYRQIDCVRNSKQAAAQAKLSPKQLDKLNTDKQIELLKETSGIDWNNYDEGKKYGRFIYREEVEYRTKDSNEPYYRHHWFYHDGFRLTSDEDYNGRERFDNLNVIPIR